MKIKIFLITLFLCSSLNAHISPESAKLEELRKLVEKNPTETNMCAYLNAFPSSFKKFKFIFYGRKNVFDELYYKHELHLDLLWKLSKNFPKKVLSIWFSIAKNGHWDADAIGILQKQLVRYGTEKTKIFAESLNKKNRNELFSIIRFIADKKDHCQYYEYIKLLEQLKKLKNVDLYNMFYEARKERMKFRHD
jgi:hypothetical protein